MDEKTISTPAGQGAGVVKYYADMEEEYTSFKKAKVVIMQVPYEKTVTYKKGTVNGPAAIIDASKKMELFDEELNQETYKIGIHTMEPLALAGASPEEMINTVYDSALELLKAGKFPVILGGEHSLSIGCAKAFKEVYPDISVLQLDAHYDLRNEYYGSRFNHGCTARRISEICPLVQTATRSLSKEEKDFLATQANGRIKSINVYDILEMPLWKDVISNALSEHIYVTIDLDAFDPSMMPAVGTPEPGGIGWYETLDLLREVSKDKKIVGFDVTELCPIEGQIAPDFLAAKLIYRFLGYIFPTKK